MIGIATTLILLYFLDRENKARDAGLRDELILDASNSKEDDVSSGRASGRQYNGGTFTSVDEARREKGDKWSGYRYIL